MRRRLVVLCSLLAVLVAPAPALLLTSPAYAQSPGGVFITGHDADFHAQAGNTTGARRLIQRAVAYVTSDMPSPAMLLVTSRMTPPSGHLDPASGMQVAGFTGFDIAAAPGQGVLDLTTVDFTAYDVVVVASDFGGTLRQAELDILNARSTDIIEYVNGGGGLVAFGQSNGGAHLTPSGGHFDFLPFLASEVSLHQTETNVTLTPFGESLGLVSSDVNGNVSHNVFTSTGGLEVVDIDAAGRILSLAGRGMCFSAAGVPAVSVGDAAVQEGANGATLVQVPVTLSTPNDCADVTVDLATADGTALAGSDYMAFAGQVVIPSGSTAGVVHLTVLGDLNFEPDEMFFVNVMNVTAANTGDGQGVVTIGNDDSPNDAPDCSAVTASQNALWSPDHTLRTVALGGATDPNGDEVTLTITGVTQDEPVDATADGSTEPDAASGSTSREVQLRAERAGRGDGRVYRIAYRADDGNGGTCLGTVAVSVPQSRNGAAAVDSGSSYDSFGT